MSGKLRQGVLPLRSAQGRLFRIEMSDEPLIVRGGLILPYEMARALKLPQVIDGELPAPG